MSEHTNDVWEQLKANPRRESEEDRELRIEQELLEVSEASKDAVIMQLQADKERLNEEIARITVLWLTEQRALFSQFEQRADYLEHVVVEAGIQPGIDYPCRCEACRAVARGLDDAHFLDDTDDRWWEEGG